MQTGGNSANGGGYKAGAGGTDRSQSTSPHVTFDGATITATSDAAGTVLTISGYTVLAGDVGNVLQISGGTNYTTGFYEITSVNTGANTWTLDRDSTSGDPASALTGRMGGCLAAASTVSGAVAVAGNTIWIKAGTYTLTSTWTFGPTSKGDTTGGRIKVYGYNSTHGDFAGRPTITSATNSVALFTLNDADFYTFRHIQFTHTAGTRGVAILGSTSISTPVNIVDCIFDGCLSITSGSLLSGLTVVACEAKNCTSTTVVFSAGGALRLEGCYIHDNEGDAVRTTNGTTTLVQVLDTILYNNQIGINDTNAGANNCTVQVINSTIHSNDGDGIAATAKTTGLLTLELCNNIIFGHSGGWGVNLPDGATKQDAGVIRNRHNAYGSNASGDLNGLSAGINDVALSGDPCTNAASGDFSLDNTASEGAACRAAGFPGAFIGGTTTGYPDIGAVQHQDSGGGGANRALLPSGVSALG